MFRSLQHMVIDMLVIAAASNVRNIWRRFKLVSNLAAQKRERLRVSAVDHQLETRALRSVLGAWQCAVASPVCVEPQTAICLPYRRHARTTMLRGLVSAAKVSVRTGSSGSIRMDLSTTTGWP